MAAYLTRISRIVLALRAHGVALSSAELDGLATKASLLAEEFGQVGGDWHPTKMVRRLRARFTAAALIGKGTTATTATSRRRFRPLVSSSLPSAASRALAPIRFGAPLPTSRRKLLVLRRRFPRPPSPRPCRAALRRRPARRLSPGWVRPSLAPHLGTQRRAPLQRSRPLRPLRAQMGLAVATLRCVPAWRQWKWSWKLLSAAPMGARLSLTVGRRLTSPLPFWSRQRP